MEKRERLVTKVQPVLPYSSGIQPSTLGLFNHHCEKKQPSRHQKTVFGVRIERLTERKCTS